MALKKKSKKTKAKSAVSRRKTKTTAKVKSKAKKSKLKAKTKKIKSKAKAVKKKVAKKVKAKVKKVKAKTKAKVKKTKAKKPKAKVAKAKPVSTKAAPKRRKPKVAMAEEYFPEPMSIKPGKPIVGSLEFAPYHIRKNEEYMNEAQREHFRNILNLWKKQLMEEVDYTVVHLKEDATTYPDPLDRASLETGFNLELRTRDRERKLIKKIEQSLDLLESGEYGYCEDCGTEIGIRRLEARPTADRCIDCKTFEEIREKQTGT